MAPPEPPSIGHPGEGTSRAVFASVSVLKSRSDFLRAARAQKQPTKTMLVQARKRRHGEADGIRVGFTCSKKLGNAVARNRAKRRLRAAAHCVLPQLGQDGWDYVLVGRADMTASRPFAALVADLRRALTTFHGTKA